MFKRNERMLVLSVATAAMVLVQASPAWCAEGVGKDQAIEKRVSALLAKMTLEEKLGQLVQESGGEAYDHNPGAKKAREEELFGMIRSGMVGSFLNAHGAEYTNRLQKVAVEETRLKIPLILGNDVIHGYRTIFPIPLGETACWEPELVEQAARVAASEASAAGTHWTFAPMVDIARDPRWGRIAEGAGEDPYLGSVIGVARVRGFQGDDLSAPDTVLACAKHYVAYGGAEGGRDYNTVDISLQTLHEIYLPPFHAAVDAGVGTLMCAFNEINGVPASTNPYVMDRILRKQWGFDGFVVSDWASIKQVMVHGFAETKLIAGEKAIVAGVDMDMASHVYIRLGESVKQGRVPEEVIDEAVRRVLRAKIRLGLFERPYVDTAREAEVMLSDANRAVARDVARHSIVLLKNDGNHLPLKKELKSVAVIGALADSKRDVLGTWAGVGRAEEAVTVLEGLKNRCPAGTELHYVKGCDANGDNREGFAEAVELARKCDLALMVIGEGEDMSGEAHCRTSLDLPGVQRELVQAVHATGTPVVVVLMNGRPLSIGWTAENVAAIVETWHLGTECGHAVAEVLFGDFNPGGKLPVTFPRTVGQIPYHYNHKNTGRPSDVNDRFTSKYIDLPSSPLYPFGYGLSYTSFVFSDLSLSRQEMGIDGTIKVSATVTNTGDCRGDEVAQLYVRDLYGCATRPVKELKGFKRITLNPGESRKVTFALSARDLSFYNPAMERVVEPGDFKVWVGPNSAEGLEGSFKIVDIH